METIIGNGINNRKLFVGNLTYSVREGELKGLFSRFGDVVSVRILEKKGYGFVEMATPEQAKAAREALSETEFEGRNLLIDGVRPHIKTKKPRGRSGQPNLRTKPSTRVGSPPGKISSGYRGKKPIHSAGKGAGRPAGRPPSAGRSSSPPRRGGAPSSRRR